MWSQLLPSGIPLDRKQQGRRAGEGVLQVLPPLLGGCGSLVRNTGKGLSQVLPLLPGVQSIRSGGESTFSVRFLVVPPSLMIG